MLYTLKNLTQCGERRCYGWLNRMATFCIATRQMLDSIADKRLFDGRLPAVSGAEEVDRYLRSKSVALPSAANRAERPWLHLVGLAASATGAEDSTKEHGVRVAKLAGLLAAELGLTQEMHR